jgi:hypothetical protein
VRTLHHKLGNATNNRKEDTPHKSKQPKIHPRLPSPGSEDEDVEQGSHADDTFVYQAGHKFFLIYGPWICLGEDMFKTEFDEAYTKNEQFENGENKVQGQLQKLLNLLNGKFEHNVLRQKWAQRAVHYFFFPQGSSLEMCVVFERTQD